MRGADPEDFSAIGTVLDVWTKRAAPSEVFAWRLGAHFPSFSVL